MQIVIDIDEDTYRYMQSRYIYQNTGDKYLSKIDEVGVAVKNGVPLPKGCGRIIAEPTEEDIVKTIGGQNDFAECIREAIKAVFDNALTIIEAYGVNLQVAVMHGTPFYDSSNIWHTIKGFNRNYSYDANVEKGVDLPDVGRDVLVIYPRSKGVYVKESTEEGMTGTNYYDGTMWAYYNKPVTDIDGGNAK